MAISKESIQKLLSLLRPYLLDKKERQAYLMRALGMDVPVLHRLDWNTPVNVFIPNMVKELVAFGEIPPSQPALCALLEVIREDVGEESKVSIDELLRRIREELKNTETLFSQNNNTVTTASHEKIVNNDSFFKKNHTLGDSIFSTPDFSDFFGRRAELDSLKKKVRESRVVLVNGGPGVGKTYVVAQIAKELSEEYKVLWLDQEKLNIDELLLQLNVFLKANGECGFDITYAEVKIANYKKIPTLIQVLCNSKNANYAIFMDNFQHTNRSEIKPFIERFSTHAGESRLILIDHLPADNSLGTSLAARVQEFSLEGFQGQEATDYIDKQSDGSGIEWLPEDVATVIEKTAGHPIALNLIVQRCRRGTSLKDVLERLVEYDQQFGANELHEKLLKDVAEYLNNEERKALQRLSVFRLPFQRLAWEHLDIKDQIGESLLQRRWLTSVGYDKFQMHPLIRNFWWDALKFQESKSLWHKKAAGYFWELGKNSKLDLLDRRSAYLEAYNHFIESSKLIESSIHSDSEAAQVVNELVCYIYKHERLPSERLPGLTAWLFDLDDTVFNDKPWLLLEKGCKIENKGGGKEAELVFQQAYEAFKQQNNELGTSVALYHVGKILCRQQPKAALKALERVLEMAEKSCPPDIPMQIRTLGKLISCYTELGDYEAARSAANDAETLAQMSDDLLGCALILYRKGSIERSQSNFSEAEKFFSLSAEAFEKLGDVYRASKSWSRLGVVQERQGKFELAITNFEKAIKIKQQINDEYGLALDLDYLADVYRSQGAYSQAINNYKKSLNIKEKTKDIYGEIKTYNNLARVALSSCRLLDANDYLQKSKERIQGLKGEKEKCLGVDGSRLIIQGDLQVVKGQYKEALRSYHEAATCFSSNHHSYARVLLSLGRTYLELRQFALAKQYLKRSLNIFKKRHTPYHESLALTYLARLACVIGQIKQANTNNREAKNLAMNIKAQHVIGVCHETQALIQKMKILKNCDFNSIKPEKKEQVREKLIHQVGKHYDKAIQKLRERAAFRELARLQVEKLLWRLTVNKFNGEKFSSEQAYQLLLTSEQFSKDIIELELINTKHTLDALHSISPLLAKQIATYTLHILSPIAMCFGFNTLREEIEDLAFQFIYPSENQEIIQFLESRFFNQQRFISRLKSELELRLKEKNIQATVQARSKAPYSIYRKKTERKGVSLEKIIDLVGVRIITQTETECYTALSIVKKMGELFKGEGILAEPIRDYIQRPKQSTGYQSIHLNIVIASDKEKFGEPEPHVVEFQLRTHKMHLAAEVGLAAHSFYKNAATYARPSSKRNNELQQQQKINVAIECEPVSVNTVGNLIRESKFEILSVDIEPARENKIILNIELVTKSKNKAWRDQDYMDEAVDQLTACFNKITNLRYKVIAENKHEFEVQGIELTIEEKAPLIHALIKNNNKQKFVHILTPKGDVKKIGVLTLKIGDKQLELKPTPIDFAYQIHSEVGNHCYKAKINGQIVALNTPLNNGDIVEIITKKNSHPSLEWLKQPKDFQKNHPFVTTKTARSRIVQWYKKLHQEASITRGRELLEKELSKKAFEVLLKSGIMQAVAESLNYRGLEDLLAALGAAPLRLSLVANDAFVEEISVTNNEEEEKPSTPKGYGILTLNQVIHQIRKIKAKRGRDLLAKELGKKVLEEVLKSDVMQLMAELKDYRDVEEFIVALGSGDVELSQIISRLQEAVEKNNIHFNYSTNETSYFKPKIVNSLIGIPSNGSAISLRSIKKECIHYAKCCHPIAYEESVGFVKSNAYKVFSKSNGRGIFIHRPECDSLKNLSSLQRRPILWTVDIKIETVNRVNMLGEITTVLGEKNINIAEMHVKAANQDKPAVIRLGIDVRNRQQLKQVQDIFLQIRQMKDVLDLHYVDNETMNKSIDT
jgi:(p)ppGpp synthase/HD superfamily hydrolase/Tfp pilus assembly protein PilF